MKDLFKKIFFPLYIFPTIFLGLDIFLSKLIVLDNLVWISLLNYYISPSLSVILLFLSWANPLLVFLLFQQVISSLPNKLSQQKKAENRTVNLLASFLITVIIFAGHLAVNVGILYLWSEVTGGLGPGSVMFLIPILLAIILLPIQFVMCWRKLYQIA